VDKISLTWREKEVVEGGAIEKLRHEIVRESLKHTGFESCLEILFWADVPGVGSGLGSSSATTVALLHALYLLRGWSDEEIEREWLASEAFGIARGLGKIQGSQDEVASSIGGLNLIHFKGGELLKGGLREIAISDHGRRQLNEHFALFGPEDADGGRDAEDVLKSCNDGRPSAKFRADCYVLSLDFEESVTNRDWHRCGQLVADHHKLKCSNFAKYLPEAEDFEREYPMKLCGAGGTGHLLVAVTPETRGRITWEVEEFWGTHLDFKFVPYGTQLIYSEDM
jgi:galactokinase/mevalonate kinase-like predicted kinase